MKEDRIMLWTEEERRHAFLITNEECKFVFALSTMVGLIINVEPGLTVTTDILIGYKGNEAQGYVAKIDGKYRVAVIDKRRQLGDSEPVENFYQALFWLEDLTKGK